jgi:hypothetical protein
VIPDVDDEQSQALIAKMLQEELDHNEALSYNDN